jgi:membrane-bound serine protease (ClpP class)
MSRIVRISLLLLFLVAALVITSSTLASSAPQIDVLRVDGAIVPAVASYIDRGISHAEENQASVVIIELSTPGGLLSTTEDIVSHISKAQIPVVVYVPKGGWAASAGAFITLAADVAAMGPESVIGASTPIAGGGGELSDDERNKAINLASQWMKSIAEEHGRNEEAAMAAVTQAASFSANEALGSSELSAHNQEILKGIKKLEPPLIDLVAEDLDELVAKLVSGITLANGETFSIPAGTQNEIGMTAIEKFLQAISDPNIAYILLALATTGLILELVNPGAILPGVVGAISLILAFYSLAVLEASWAGVFFIVLGFILFILEAFVTSYGMLTIGAIASLVMGSVILFGGGPELFHIDWWVVTLVVILFSAIFLFFIGAIIRAHRRRPTTGKEGLIGKTATAQTTLDPTGMVLVEGELWTATSEKGKIEVGEEVIVTKVEGLKLTVTKKQQGG